ncbi:hypothetical protein RGQ29_000127 [Quercus rubra]|uniref:Late embryogenesis abundant protein n=1 Tax=Quercus rubra TaxID=3512 RepID=A0AAN7G2P8_QUERU|nr:hypothetical protein RGQ29_000126 [Quercus rubra]KAK4605692.1 hypothetical protein RGQ29_000127 [Quercus rubra]
MASLTLIISFPKFGHAGSAIVRRSTWNPRLFAACTPRRIQASSNPEASSPATDALKQGANDAKKTGETVKDKAYSTAEHVSQNTKDMAGKMSATAQDATEKVKQTAQEAWGSAKDTAQKAKDNVLGKTEESKESIKESAEAVKNSMNTKN